MRDHPERGTVSPTDLTLRAGRYIPDASLDADERTARIEAYLMALSEELEHILPALASMSGEERGEGAE